MIVAHQQKAVKTIAFMEHKRIPPKFTLAHFACEGQTLFEDFAFHRCLRVNDITPPNTETSNDREHRV